MPKRKKNKSNGSKKAPPSNSSSTNVEHNTNTYDITNVSVHSNDEDFLDNIEETMNKRRKHVKNFYNDSANVPGSFDSDGNMLADCVEVPISLPKKTKSSIKTNQLQVGQSNSTVINDFSSTLRTTTTSSHLDVVSSSNNNIKLNRGANKSLSTRENYPSDKHSFDTSSNSLVVDNEHDRSSNIRLLSTQESFDSREDTAPTTMKHATPRVANAAMNHQPSYSSDNVSSEANVNKKKTQYISKSSITISTPVPGDNHIRDNFSQNKKSFDVNRSIIRLPDRNSQTRENRPSTSTPVQLRAIDVQCSIEYRELEKKNKELKTQVANLKVALKILGRQLNKMKTTHMLKPRPAFWNELTVFMDSYSELFKGDGRTIAEIGAELGLNQAMIQHVQQDAEKPDKVAMNIWRTLCPTQADRVYVESIKCVPATTLQNIY
ncbi:unnamed protein product, partial [Rotaria sp. Silwood1]